MSLTSSVCWMTPRRQCVRVRPADLLMGGFVLVLFGVLARSAVGADLKPAVEERVKNATVYIWTYRSERSQADTPVSTGSGYFINRTGLAITNNHVVDPGHGKSPIEKHLENYEGGKLSWKVVLNSGSDSEKTYAATVLYQNEPADQALLQVYDENGGKYASSSYLRLLPESRLRKLEETWSLGFPGGDRQARQGQSPKVQIEKGNILDLPRTPGGRLRMIYTDALVRPGNSGGPCVDREGFLVGTVTLMKPPEGREDTGGGRYSALVPAKLTGEIVRNAFLLGKIDEGADFTPFVESVTEQSGLVNISEFARRDDRDTLYFDNGDRYLGSIGSETIRWKSSLGEFSFPTGVIAYIMRREEGADLYLEGGNRLSGDALEGEFTFRESGGEEFSVPFQEVSVIAFRTAGRKMDPVLRDTVVLDTDLCHLVLTSSEGEAVFKNRLGKRSVALHDIDRIDTSDDDKRILAMVNGSRITGEFDSQPVQARLAGLGADIALNLSQVNRALVERRSGKTARLEGLDMRVVFAEARPEIRAIFEKLDADPKGAAADLGQWTDRETLRKLPQADQDRVRLLEAMSQLRTGKYDEATKSFRAVSRAEDGNLASFALAHMEVLKKFPDNQFDGQSLSDRAAFAQAARSVADEYLRTTRDFLKDARQTKVERRGVFLPLLFEAKRQEQLMGVAAVLRGAEAEDLMIRVWKAVIDTGVQEIQRILAEEGQSLQGDSRGRRGSRGGGIQLDLEGNPDLKKAYEAVMAYISKRYDYGFHIEDPDVDSVLDKRRALAE